MSISNKDKFRLRHYATFSKSQLWEKYLRPDLEKIKTEVALSEGDLDTIDKSAVRDIKRATTVQVINRILRLIERAEDKLK